MNSERNRTFVLSSLVLFALCGAWVSGTLLVEHAGGWETTRQGTGFLLSLCEPDSIPAASCAAVVGSRFGSFDFSLHGRRIVVPTSFVGLAYFVSLAIWLALVVGRTGWGRWLGTLTVLIISGGFAGSLFFLGVMAFSLSHWCSLCVIAHGFNLVLLVGTVYLHKRTRAALPSISVAIPVGLPVVRVLHRRLAITGVAMAAVCVAGLWFYYDSMSEARRQWRKVRGYADAIATMQNDTAFMLREYYAQPVVDPATDGVWLNQAGSSPQQAASSLILFSDFDSSACACFEKRWANTLVDGAAGAVGITYRHLPGESAGGAIDGHQGPSESQSAALAAEAARLGGGERAYREMRHLLFEHRKDSPRRDYAALARAAGLNVERFLEDMGSEAVREIVMEDVRLATRWGVQPGATGPALFLNGRRVPDICLRSDVFWHAMANKATQDRPTALEPMASESVVSALENLGE
ncbi:MAG: thioredoxin domain-containing protein [Planctomycetes bacterium]|nr:thioredoxin domain-containing protein [Planctomycetota bacterium]